MKVTDLGIDVMAEEAKRAAGATWASHCRIISVIISDRLNQRRLNGDQKMQYTRREQEGDRQGR